MTNERKTIGSALGKIWCGLLLAAVGTLTLAHTAFASDIGGNPQPAMPYYWDACPDTCGSGCDSITYVGSFWDYCCTSDAGCWANPFEPDYQKHPAERDEKVCTIGMASMPCCSQWYNDQEEDGQPCCEPQNGWTCP